MAGEEATAATPMAPVVVEAEDILRLPIKIFRAPSAITSGPAVEGARVVQAVSMGPQEAILGFAIVLPIVQQLAGLPLLSVPPAAAAGW